MRSLRSTIYVYHSGGPPQSCASVVASVQPVDVTVTQLYITPDPLLIAQASSALAAAAGEVQAALASMHAVFAGDSAEVHKEWARFVQKVRSTWAECTRCSMHNQASVALLPTAVVA